MRVASCHQPLHRRRILGIHPQRLQLGQLALLDLVQPSPPVIGFLIQGNAFPEKVLALFDALGFLERDLAAHFCSMLAALNLCGTASMWCQVLER